jgi:hypothetical protein
MVEQAAREHSHRKIAALAISGVQLLAEPPEFLEIELPTGERAQFGKIGF